MFNPKQIQSVSRDKMTVSVVMKDGQINKFKYESEVLAEMVVIRVLKALRM
ncbi:hypothetical protein EC844_12552 [Acinetobacter calcoaceticus]|uniref:FERM domain-containing protein n=1 Tax=Acinetobacter calcoaceticus TaxID=471 RepID=A0A4R1XF00_ACICA|nr:hypothetical protein EC844_12552 [Acinetobacter calcoaceticus]